MSISNEIYRNIMAEAKEFTDSTSILLGPSPQKWTRTLLAPRTKDPFYLDFRRGTFELKKYTYNKRYRTSIVLARYDSYGVHTNPDDVKMSGPHIHLYRDGYGDKFAFPVTEIGVTGTESIDEICKKFLEYCNVTNTPQIQTSFI